MLLALTNPFSDLHVPCSVIKSIGKKTKTRPISRVKWKAIPLLCLRPNSHKGEHCTTWWPEHKRAGLFCHSLAFPCKPKPQTYLWEFLVPLPSLVFFIPIPCLPLLVHSLLSPCKHVSPCLHLCQSCFALPFPTFPLTQLSPSSLAFLYKQSPLANISANLLSPASFSFPFKPVCPCLYLCQPCFLHPPFPHFPCPPCLTCYNPCGSRPFPNKAAVGSTRFGRHSSGRA